MELIDAETILCKLFATSFIKTNQRINVAFYSLFIINIQLELGSSNF
jgi:hypothetical protein